MQMKLPSRRFWLGSAPWLLLTLLLIAGTYWFYNREPAGITLDYGKLKLLLSDQSRAVQFKNVKVGRTEIRGEIVTIDEVSDGSLTSSRQMQVKSFRTPR